MLITQSVLLINYHTYSLVTVAFELFRGRGRAEEGERLAIYLRKMIHRFYVAEYLSNMFQKPLHVRLELKNKKCN